MSQTYTREQIKEAIWQELKESGYAGENNDRSYEVIGIVIAGLDKVKCKSQSGPEWVKASERTPSGHSSDYHWRFIHNKKPINRNFHIESGRLIQEYGNTKGSYSLEELEWLDESGSPAADIEWDSKRMIGRVRDRFDELEEKGHEWRSFYIGWLEGRADMLQQIKRWGKYKTPAAAREEDAVSKEVLEFIRDIAYNWDCDEDGHKYNTGCRKCSASELYYDLTRKQK